MAGSAGAGDIELQQNFFRSMRISIDITAETLRELINTKLEVIRPGFTLRQHIDSCPPTFKKQKKKLFLEQKQLLNRQDVHSSMMDVSLLTFLLVNAFSVDIKENDCLTKLRESRNKLAHATRCQLDNTDIFVETKLNVCELCKNYLPKDTCTRIMESIRHLEGQQLLGTFGRLDLVNLKKGNMLLKLIDTDTVDRVQRIRFGLVTFVKHIARYVDIMAVVSDLEHGGVTFPERETLRADDSNLDLATALVTHMLDETDEKVLKLSSCLRQYKPIIADMIEYTNTGGNEIESQRQRLEHNTIIDILNTSLVESDGGSVSCEDVHIYINEQRRYAVKLPMVIKCVKEVFKEAVDEDECSQFQNLSWKSHLAELDELVTDGVILPLTNMTSERFAIYLGDKMSEISEDLKEPVAEVVRDQSISSQVFVDIPEETIEALFKEKVRYNFGVKMGLKKVQDDIKLRQSVPEQVETLQFRPFETAAFGIRYKICTIENMQGQTLLEPVRQFTFPKRRRELSPSYIAKSVIRFASACINSRQNGTLHYGIQPKENGKGLVKGVQLTAAQNDINISIENALQSCFTDTKEQSQIKHCIRPVQFVPVNGGPTFVLEIDIVPHNCYLKDELYSMLFPPCGHQKSMNYIFWNSLYAVETVRDDHVESFKEDVLLKIKQRKDLEHRNQNTTEDDTARLKNNLRQCLTWGRDYITDGLFPVIVVGNWSRNFGINNMLELVDDLRTPFLSTPVVFHFDESTQLLTNIEQQKQYFNVITAEQSVDSLTSLAKDLNIWLYCNGNVDLQQPKMVMKDFFPTRHKNVHDLMKTVVDMYGNRTQIIVLVFEKLTKGLNDPFFYFVESLKLSFNQSPVILSAIGTDVSDMMETFQHYIKKKEFQQIFHNYLPWKESTNTLASVFRQSSSSVYKLPDSKGGFVEMSMQEKAGLSLGDLEIISGDQCTHLLNEMTDTARLEKDNETKSAFFRGEDVSWWNFEFGSTHVCQRSVLKGFVQSIKAVCKGESYSFEIIEILHHPGAGGSTLGKHLLWRFSQFTVSSRGKYRCCVVNNVQRKETARQITRLRNFRYTDTSEVDPVIALIDDKPEDMIKHFKDDIALEAYQNGSKKNVFCILIVVSRVETSHFARRIPTLQHRLEPDEIRWFEDRYKSEMKSFGEAHVKSLLAFNVMKENFSKKYIEETTDRIMKGLSKREEELVKHLSVLNAFDLLESPIPASIFDNLMNVGESSYKEYNFEYLIREKRPFGLIDPHDNGRARSKTWNAILSESCSLLLKDRELCDDKFDLPKGGFAGVSKHVQNSIQALTYQKGIMIVSPLVAEAILKMILRQSGKSMSDLVGELLTFTKEQRQIVGSYAGEYFTGVVCSLFKTRKTQQYDGGQKKEQFSKLITYISDRSGNTQSEVGDVCQRENDGQQTNTACLLQKSNEANVYQDVIQLIKQCRKDLADPYVGQQLARFYYLKLKQFDNAETEIKLSIEMVKTNPFLYDTLGQTYKAKMKDLLDNNSHCTDQTALSILEAATTAIQYFIHAQECNQEKTSCKPDGQSQKHEFDEVNSFYHNEIDTALTVLEKRSTYIGSDYDGWFIDYLNGTPCKEFDYLLPYIGRLCKGGNLQVHVEDSLRQLEYKRAMIKRKFSEYDAHITDYPVIHLRGRFMKIYGSKEKFRCGETYQSLKDNDNANGLSETKKIANTYYNLLSSPRTTSLRQSDLLRYIGAKLMLIACEKATVSTDEYNTLLKYTKELVSRQANQKRPYIEPYLYFCLFHWPLRSRIIEHQQHLARLDFITQIMDEWKKKFSERFKRLPTLYFALVKGKPGNDIIDQDFVRQLWYYKNTNQREVQSVDIWNDPDFRDRYVRLEGVVAHSGDTVKYEVDVPGCSGKKQSMSLKTYHNCERFSNRRVTFIVGFTWKGPTALGVSLLGENDPDETPEDKQVGQSNSRDNESKQKKEIQQDNSSKLCSADTVTEMDELD